MSEKNGWSEEKTDIWGNKYIQHYDGDGNEIGWSEEKTGFLGDHYTQHYDKEGNKTGYSEEKSGLFGDEYTQHYNKDGSKTGYSEEKKSLFGSEYIQHYDEDYNKYGWSEEKASLFGNKYTQHYDTDDKRVDVAESKYNEEDNGDTDSDENNNYSTHLNNYSSSKNESSSGKKTVWFVLIFGITIAIILIIKTTNNKKKSPFTYEKTVISQANKSVIESTGNQNKKQQSKDNYEPKTSIPAPQAKLTKKMQNIPAFQIKHERKRYRDKAYYTTDDAKVKFLDNDTLEIRIKVDRVTINCTWSPNDHAYVGTWRRDVPKRGLVSELLLKNPQDDRPKQGKIKLFPRFDSNNEIKCFYGYIMSYNAYIWQIGWSYGNDYSGTPIKIVPTFGCNCPDPEGD